MAPLMSWPERVFSPDIELKETGDAYVFTADVPGLGEEDVDVTVSGDQVTLSGKRDEGETRADEQYLCHERSYGSFSRSFTLRGDADTENLTAELTNGVLRVMIPKRPEVQAKRIPIHSAKQIEQEGSVASERTKGA